MTSTAPSWARVGVKCVCIDGKPRPRSTGVLPTERAIYTIRRIAKWNWLSGDSGTGVWLKELRRPIGQNGVECPWSIERFAPLVSRTQTQDTAMFRQLVDELPILERAMLYEEVLNEQWGT